MAVSLALVHHANQYLITDGYDNREGISDIVGSETDGTGILAVLSVHEAEGVPLNLHLSGTLLEAVAWHHPEAIRKLREYIERGLIELAGSSYGQNIMRFFSPEYNRRQLNEELHLYELLLGVPPQKVKVFWPPERVWDTRRMAPVLRDANLLNDGYRYVIVDDRTLLSPRDPDLPRSIYDQGHHWTPDSYQAHEYSCEILEQGNRSAVRLINMENGSPAKGLEKYYELGSSDAALTVRYRLPEKLNKLSVDCALSPDYLALLRYGSEIVTPIQSENGRGFEAHGVSIVLETDPALKWEKAKQEWIGHGRTLRVAGRKREFELRLEAA